MYKDKRITRISIATFAIVSVIFNCVFSQYALSMQRITHIISKPYCTVLLLRNSI